MAAAEQWIEGHEERCAERYGELKKELGTVNDTLSGLPDLISDATRPLWGRLWAAAIGIIALLVGACGFLIALVLEQLQG